jgi:hypothetical protein
VRRRDWPAAGEAPTESLTLSRKISTILFEFAGRRKMLKQQLRVGTSSYSWFQLVSVSPRFAQDATYWERFYWEKRPII